MRAPVPADEAERLRALHDLAVLDTPPEPDFDDIASMASTICGMPMSLVSLVDADRQWFKARIGVEAPETPRDLSFCAHAILGRDVLVVPDASRDERFADNPAVRARPGVRCYAGAPLLTTDGYALGTLCVVDTEPRRLTLEQLQALRALARQVTAQLELRRYAAALDRTSAGLHEIERRHEDLLELVCGDLRTPLRAFRSYLDQLDSGREPDAVTRTAAAEGLRRHAGSLRRLLDDLAGVAAAGGDTPLRMREVDLTHLTARAVAAVRPIARSRRIGMLNQAGPVLPVHADPVRLEQALMHLLFTAIKYTPRDGRLRVRTEVEAGPAVRVDDLDLPDRERPSLFNHFYYGAIAQPGDCPGPDHGLALAKRVLDVHHATVALSDRPGDGTALHVVFPEAHREDRGQ